MRSAWIQFVLALTLLTMALGAYAWWYSKVTHESAVATTLLAEVRAKEDSQRRAGTVGEALSKLVASQDTVQSYFLSETNIVAFLSEIEATGLATGARVKVLSVGAPTGKSGEQVIAASITVEGSFDAVLRSVGAIENAPYALTITSFAINKTDTTWLATLGITVGSRPSATMSGTDPARTQKAATPPVKSGELQPL